MSINFKIKFNNLIRKDSKTSCFRPVSQRACSEKVKEKIINYFNDIINLRKFLFYRNIHNLTIKFILKL